MQDELELERAERDEVEATHEALQEYTEDLELKHRALEEEHKAQMVRTKSELVRGPNECNGVGSCACCLVCVALGFGVVQYMMWHSTCTFFAMPRCSRRTVSPLAARAHESAE